MATLAAWKTPPPGEKRSQQDNNILGLQENGGTPSTNADDQLLVTLGYQPELRRNFSYLTTFGQSFGATNSIFNLAILGLRFVRIQVDVHPTIFMTNLSSRLIAFLSFVASSSMNPLLTSGSWVTQSPTYPLRIPSCGGASYSSYYYFHHILALIHRR